MTVSTRSDEEVVQHLRAARFVAIVGSRNLDTSFRPRVADLIGRLDAEATVVSGGAPGVDTWAEELAAERGLRCAVVRPSRKGMALAGDYFRRNEVIVRGAEVVVAFWNRESRGTLDSIRHAMEHHGYCIVLTHPEGKPEIWREGEFLAK